MTPPPVPHARPETPPTQDDPRLECQRLRTILATIVVNVLVVGALAFAPWSDWRTGIGLNVIDNAILVAHALRRRDAMMWRLIAFGLRVGLLELPTDAWIIDVTRTLDYSPGGGPMLWRSPFWMPLAWQVVAVQFGYVGLRLKERFGWPGLLLAGALGALNIPYYEEMALRIHWWRYHGAAMVPGTHTPWAIVIGEFLIAIYLGYFATWLRRPNKRTTIPRRNPRRLQHLPPLRRPLRHPRPGC